MWSSLGLLDVPSTQGLLQGSQHPSASVFHQFPQLPVGTERPEDDGTHQTTQCQWHHTLQGLDCEVSEVMNYHVGF